MHVTRLGLLLASLLALAPRPSAASSSCSSSADLAALAEVKSLVTQQCDCASAMTPHTYLRCAMAVAGVAVAQGRLSSGCLSTLRKCASQSTCGRPGAVACCRTTLSGRKKCSIKRDAILCRAPKGGTACVSEVASCCEACDPNGGCSGTTTSTTSTTSTTTSTSPATLPPPTTTTTTSATPTTAPGPVCGNGVREAGEVCDCGFDGCDAGDDFGGVTCPGSSAAGAFLECVNDCTAIDASACPTGGSTSTTARPPSTTTSTSSTTTTSSSTSTTSSTLPPVQCTDPILHLPPLLNVPLQTIGGSSTCGGPGFVPPASSPFVGTVSDGSNHTLAQLGTNCLYAGSGAAPVGGLPIPSGNETVVSIVGLRGTRAIFGPSDGDGPASCTRGAGPGRHCIDGRPGRDGHGLCTTDADCSGVPGSCALDANCFFAPPLGIANVLPGVSACAVSTALDDFCGDIDILGFATNVRGALSNRIYLATCPTCVSGRCNGGPRDGQRCSASSAGTSVDCPPDGAAFLGAFASNISLSSEPTTLTGTNGAFCPGQSVAGAFGLPAARRIRTDGTRPNLLTLQATIAGPFCVTATGNPVVDLTLGLPAPAAVGARARINLLDVLRLFGR
ncbi:MAG TPA: hypothetical protein VMS22_02810 [Candidatus Eisenbacteria bacterium]|nr:hypothetical protein [Candidatus Eisenbacteria bacterium]